MLRIALLCLLLLPCFGFGQSFLTWKNDRYFSLSAGTGMATYFGELNARKAFNERIRQGNLALEARLLSHWSARAEVLYYTLEGKDNNAKLGTFERQRNLSFRSHNWETNLQALYYLKPYAGDYYRRWNTDIYVGAGVGLTTYNPYTFLGGKKYMLRDYETEEGKPSSKFTMVLPLTAGMKFKVNDFTNVIFEISYHYTFNDYLDDVSGKFPLTYANAITQQLSNRKDEIGIINQDAYDAMVPGGERGNTNTRDSYLLVSFKAEIYLPQKLFKDKKTPVLKKSKAK
jgi:hypothetical protein